MLNPLVPPYRVIRPPEKPVKKSHIVAECTLTGGPLDGLTRKEKLDEHGNPPHILNCTPQSSWPTGKYRLVPGTRQYVWR